MDKIEVLLCRTGKSPEWISLENSLAGIEKEVPAYEEYFPFRDENTAILVRSAAEGLSKNRSFCSRDGITAVVKGDFLVVYAPLGERYYRDFPNERMKTYYENLFRDPKKPVLVDETETFSDEIPDRIQNEREDA